jgi:hypothetical protein
MPLTIQLGEVADRLRRFFDVRGRMPTVLDETIVPVINLTDLSGAPYRRNPLAFQGGGDSDGGIAGTANWVIWQHDLTHEGASLVTHVTVNMREGSSASGAVVWLMVGHNEAAAGGAEQTSGARLEPLGYHGGNVDYLPLQQRETQELFTAMEARQSRKIDEKYFTQAQTPGHHTFTHQPILLTKGGFIAVGCQDVSGAAVPPEMACSIGGLFYNTVPR